jgi:hypothetical protein
LTVGRIVEIRGDLLIWDFRELKEKPTPRNLLERFCGLHRIKNDEAILKFARSSGPLGHCEHGRLACCPTAEWRHVKGSYYADSIEGWRRLSAIMAGLCRAASRVAQLRPGLWSDFLVYPGQATWREGTQPWKNLGASRQQLQLDVNNCLRRAQVGPGIEWRQGRWNLYMRSHLIPTLYGELSQQLVLQIANVDGVYQCDGCPELFLPDRRPNPNRRNYCHECREHKIPQRDAKRAKRARDSQQDSY